MSQETEIDHSETLIGFAAILIIPSSAIMAAAAVNGRPEIGIGYALFITAVFYYAHEKAIQSDEEE